MQLKSKKPQGQRSKRIPHSGAQYERKYEWFSTTPERNTSRYREALMFPPLEVSCIILVVLRRGSGSRQWWVESYGVLVDSCVW